MGKATLPPGSYSGGHSSHSAGRVGLCGSGNHCGFPPYGWGLLGTAIGILSLGVFIHIFITLATTRCFICESYLWPSKRKRKQHRIKCAKKHQILLDNLPTRYKICCPNCGQGLKEWPEYRMLHPDEPLPKHWKPLKFTCDGRDCHSKRKFKLMGRLVGSKRSELMVEEGYRYCCYLCDYDLCFDCVIKVVANPRKNLIW